MFSGGRISYGLNGDKVLLFCTQVILLSFYNPEKMQVTLACAGEYGLADGSGKTNRLLIYRLESG